jgi:predicted nucleotidyltransferase component of viral defense system
MSAPDAAPLRLHDDAALFGEAVNFTAAETGFPARLIEKDYFCTVLLQCLAPARGPLVFKGGTCLAKVHAGFYRLSEDLDFVIPTPVDATRGERRSRARALRDSLARIDRQLPGFRVTMPLTGANNSTQYLAVIGYSSPLGGEEGTIQVEVSLREPLLNPVALGEARTLLLDPVSGSALAPPVSVPCLSREEAMAEKLRAALTRRRAAIRDFYDIDHAVRRLGFRPEDPELVALVRRKLAVAGNEPVDASPTRLAALRPQLETELRPVLRARDFAEFDLDRAFDTVARLAASLGAR